MIWPFIPEFTAEARGTEQDLGFYVGILASSFFCAQFSTSIVWGWASDTFGRRPVILLGLTGSTLAMMLLGVSRTYGLAMCSRIMAGMLNGNIGATKALMSELLPGHLRAQGFGLLSFNWGLGSVLGPIVGGFLSRPAEQFGWSAPFWSQFPYFLPCMFSAGVSFLGIAIGYFFLQDGPEFKAPDNWRENLPDCEGWESTAIGRTLRSACCCGGCCGHTR